MGERKGTKGLELWCRRMCEGYPGVNISNMTSSWRDGLAFCAIIHHFRPDLIDFSKLNKDDVYHNNELAFRIAERHLGIPALLEAQDMVRYPVPDRLSILTYLSQFYQAFVVSQGSTPNRIAPKRPASSPDHSIVSSASPTPTKFPAVITGKLRRLPCAKCKLPVFMAERLNVGKLLYHRTCFRCARCNSQLTLANYYETESNEFCCEICPDEVTKLKEKDKLMLTKSLSDEEKTAELSKQSQLSVTDEYSSKFETALEFPKDNTLSKSFTLNSELSAEYSNARSQFIQTQFESSESESDSGNDGEPPDLPTSKPPVFNIKSELLNKDNGRSDNSNVQDTSLIQSAHFDSGFPSSKLDSVNSYLVSNSSLSDQQKAASSPLDESYNNVTKEDTVKFESTSLVKTRMQLFESNSTNIVDKKSDVNKETSKVPLDDSKSKNISELTNKDNILHKTNESGSTVTKSTDVNTIIKNKPSNISEVPSEDLHTKNISISEKPRNDNSISTETRSLKNKDSETIVKKQIKEKPAIPPKTFNSTTKMRSEPTNILSKDYKVINKINSAESITDPSTSTSNEIDKLDKDTDKNNDSIITISTNDSVISIMDTSTETNLHEISTTSSDRDDSSSIIIDLTNDSRNSTVNESGNSGESETKSLSSNNKQKTSVTSVEIQEEYPDDLNPFDDSEDEKVVNVSLNPFGDCDDEDEVKAVTETPKPAIRKKIKPDQQLVNTPGSKIYMERISVNPFEEDSSTKLKSARKLIPAPRISLTPIYTDDEQSQERSGKKLIAAPKISLNPFWSEDEDDEEGPQMNSPMPTPRSSKSSIGLAEPRRDSLHSSSTYGSSSSIHSTNLNPMRKKKIAPKPPSVINNETIESGPSSLTSSPSNSAKHSPRLTPIPRKQKKAPLPPSVTSTPYLKTSAFPEIAISPLYPINTKDTYEKDIESEKVVKDEMNRNKQLQSHQVESPSSSESSMSLAGPNKSTYGKWKRRKGQAPSRPIPQRRIIKPLPIVEINRELEVIEIQQQGLEKQGVRLEQIIREKCEGDAGITNDDSLAPEVEDMILQLFELVNEKNELFRKQAELMYLRRQQRLEEEHADVEYQIRCLMLQPEVNKTDCDKTKEEELINRLVDIVERRNEIIDCLEMDRVREAEEDNSISCHLNQYAMKKEDENSLKDSKQHKKEKKKHKKEKKIKKKGQVVDMDKDVDETETSPIKEKTKKKKKFNIF